MCGNKKTAKQYKCLTSENWYKGISQLNRFLLGYRVFLQTFITFTRTHLIDRYIEPPDPPNGITLERKSATHINHILHWTSSNAEQPFKSVDNYIVIIVEVSQSPPQSFTVSDRRLSILLNYNTNYIINIRAVNCAGSSTNYEANISTEGKTMKLKLN